MKIQIFGGPGVGKSTLAARAFSELKSLQYNVGLVQEYVKEFAVHGDDRPKYWDYVHTFGEQMRREYLLFKQGHEVIVTCSPLLLQCVYAEKHARCCSDELIQLALKFEQDVPNVSFFILRSKDQPYSTDGRWETFEQAKGMDREIQSFLSWYDVPLILLRYDEVDKIVKEVQWKLRGNT